MTVLTTRRLTLAPHRAEDFADYAAMWADPVVTRFIGGRPFGAEDAWSRLLRYAGLWSLLGHGAWAMRETATDRFVGDVGFVNFHRAIEPAFGDAPEAAWATMPWAHGQGLAREALTAALDWIDTDRRAVRTVCMIDPANAASVRLAEAVGYCAYADTVYKDSQVRLFERFSSVRRGS